MTTLKRLLFTTLLVLIGISSIANTLDEIEIIKANYKKVLLSEDRERNELLSLLVNMPKEKVYSDQMVVELMERYSINAERVKQLLAKLQSDGSWSDIDYANKNRSGWQAKVHAERILELTKVYFIPESGFYQSSDVKKAIHLTLNYWFENKPVSPNWWHNQIGVPKVLGGVFILMEKELSELEKKEAIAVMSNAKFGMTGQNKVWLAGNVLVRALLENDYSLVEEARNNIVSEIKDGEKEGIQADNSFHQHGTQLQMGNYGAAYISSMSFWADIFKGTAWAFNQSQLNLLSRLINEGYARILWKGYMDINHLGRQFFNNAQRHKAFTVGFSSYTLTQIDKENSRKYDELLKDNFYDSNKNTTLTGFYNFWQSDNTVHRRPAWMASVKMSSPRVIGGEALNGDNMKGYYLADGAMYTYVDGNEYNNVYVCWDWRKVPGVTSYETTTPMKVLKMTGYHNRSVFAGAVGDETTGLTAFDFDRDRLKARKSWIFTDEYIICLGAGIETDSSCVVTTSIEQREQNGDLYRLNKNRWEPIKTFEKSGTKEERFFHDKTGYIVLDNASIKASIESRTASWHDVMNSYSKNFTESKNVFSLWLDHGYTPSNRTYQYVIIPASTPDKTKKFNIKDIKIIANDKSKQVVYISSKKVYYLAVYEPSEISLSKNITIKTNSAGLFILKQNGKKLDIIVSDPTQKEKEFHFTINNNSHRIPLPQGELAGKSTGLSIDL